MIGPERGSASPARGSASDRVEGPPPTGAWGRLATPREVSSRSVGIPYGSISPEWAPWQGWPGLRPTEAGVRALRPPLLPGGLPGPPSHAVPHTLPDP